MTIRTPLVSTDSPMHITRRLKTVVIAALTAGLLAGAAPMALAGAPDESGVVNRGTSFGGWVYQGDGYIVLSGPPLAQGCVGEGFSEPPALFIAPRNGSSQEKYSYPHEPLLVFDDPGINVFEWLGPACEAATDGDPSTVPPAPIATGVGRLNVSIRVDAKGRTHFRNGVVGKVETTGGRRVHLSTFAQYVIDENGVEDLRQLWVKYGG